MTKLEQLLIKNSEKIIESQSTYSIYYYVGNIKIRVSDHLGVRDDNDLFIYIPVNDVRNRTYIVTLPGSSKFLCWTTKQIMEIIPFLQLQKEMFTEKMKVNNNPPTIDPNKVVTTEEIKIIMPLVKVNQEGLSQDDKKIVLRGKTCWTQDEINKLPKLLEHSLKTQNIVLNDDFKIFLNNIPTTFKQALNIYDIIVNDNQKEITIELCQQVLKRLDTN